MANVHQNGCFIVQISGLLLGFAPYLMTRHLPLLNVIQRRAVDQPPVFNQLQRQFFSALPDWATQFLATHSRDAQRAQLIGAPAREQSISLAARPIHQVE
jgi:hypothetical protein